MANSPVNGFSSGAPAALTDLFYTVKSPFGVGDDRKLTVQETYDAINVLAAAAALTGADKLPAFQGAATVGATLAQVLTYIQNNISTVLNLNGSAFTIVGGSANSTTNGTNLVNAYAAAKLATPQGAALSKNNRFTIFLLPGVYTLTGGALVMDTQFIDIVGLSTNSGSMHWTTGGFTALEAGDIQLQSTGNTLGLTAAANVDVTIANLALLSSGASGNYGYNPSVTGPQFKMRNVFIQNTAAQTNAGMAPDVSYDGFYEDVRCWNTSSFASRVAGTSNAIGVFIRCKAAQTAFGGSNADGTNGQATGLFIDCEADGGSFGRNVASGTFIRCRFVNVTGTVAGMFGHGSGGAASGIFLQCDGNNSACFGGGSAGGTFRFCTSGAAAFGFSGTANGTFEWCSCVGAAGTNSFGGTSSNGTFRHCEVTGSGNIGFGQGVTITGTFEWCRAGDGSFAGSGGTGGTFNGIARHCVGGTNCFGSGGTTAGTMSGTLENCAMSGHMRVTLTGKITNMRIESVAANTTALQLGSGSTGAIYDSTIIGTGSGLSIDVISGTPTVKIAHCRLNKSIGASVTNAIATPYNVDDSAVI